MKIIDHSLYTNNGVKLSFAIRFWLWRKIYKVNWLIRSVYRRIKTKKNHDNPKLFFKYKSLNNIDNLKEVIERGKIFFPNRNQLNDPFEGMKTKLNLLGVMGGSICDAGDIEYGFVSGEREKYRILSLSSDCFSPLMWAHYGDTYKGICFCFRADKSFSRAKRVKYIRNDDLIPHDTLDDIDSLRKTIEKDLYLKHADWRYENEWRITEKKEDSKEKEFFYFDKTELVAVIWGENADKEKKKELQASIPKEVKQFRTHIGGQSGKIKLILDSEKLLLDGNKNDFTGSLDELYDRLKRDTEG